jgi:hypothetical protein
MIKTYIKMGGNWREKNRFYSSVIIFFLFFFFFFSFSPFFIYIKQIFKKTIFRRILITNPAIKKYQTKADIFAHLLVYFSKKFDK